MSEAQVIKNEEKAGDQLSSDSAIFVDNQTTVTSKIDPVNIESTLPIDPTEYNTVCHPISCLKDLWKYCYDPPEWIKDIVPLHPRSETVMPHKEYDCHVESEDFKPVARLDRHTVPKTLVCHDMQGGYLKDKCAKGCCSENGYTFYRWSYIDIFVYFSHHLVTVPPIGWINSSHKNGCKILGTFITEWDDGKAICDAILSSSELEDKVIKALVDICLVFQIDGWLLNIENKISNFFALVNFVKRLTDSLHFRKPGAVVIWYDSVIKDGALKWQNELNSDNRVFFDVCDGIFLNYNWKKENLKHSVDAAGPRILDVYVGIDVFGRNCFWGKGWNVCEAAKMIRTCGLSMALFAPGWSYETVDSNLSSQIFQDTFFKRDSDFWRCLYPFLYTHPINRCFETSFHFGVNSGKYDLNKMEISVNYPVPWKDDLDSSGCCTGIDCQDRQLCTYGLTLIKHTSSPDTYIRRLFICDIKIKESLMIVVSTKTSQDLILVLLLRTCSGAYRKAFLHTKNLGVICPGFLPDILLPVLPEDNSLITDFKKNSDSWIFPGWNNKYFCVSTPGATLLEIGASVEEDNTSVSIRALKVCEF